MSPIESYTRDIDSYFGAYKNHPAIVLARKLSQTGVGHDAVMTMAVHLSPAPALRPLIPFTDEIPGKRWGKSNAVQFAALLHDFYIKTDFARFFAVHRPLYGLAEERFTAITDTVDLGWFTRFYGEKPIRQFHVVLAMNNGGGNYGSKVAFPDGHQEAFAIVGCWTTDNAGNPSYQQTGEYLPTVIHEFNHSFVNPIVESNWTRFKSAEKVFRPVANLMRSQAYGNAQDMINESLVRAAVIVYSRSNGNPQTVERSIREEQVNGFVWMEELVNLLERYQAERTPYKRFQEFMPVIADFYESLAPRINTELARFSKQCVHVTGLRPFANHDQRVDPAIREIIVSFDKPLDPAAGFSANYGPKGKSEFPISVRPEFLPGNKEIKLQLNLKANSNYAFELSGASSIDGYPLEGYAVEFHTK